MQTWEISRYSCSDIVRNRHANGTKTNLD